MSYDPDYEASRWERLKTRLKNTYRLVVMNNETFREVSAFNISLLNLWILGSTLIVVVAAIVLSIIIFTPLKRYIPGYAAGNDPELVFELEEQIEDLEKQLTSQINYTNNVRKVLVGEDFQTEEDIETTSPISRDSVFYDVPVPQSATDEQLREEVEFEAIQTTDQKPYSFKPQSAVKPLEQIFFSAPVNGEITAPFMPEKKHFGVDVSSPKNTPIKAALAGFIFFSDWTLETGNTIGIQHDNNIITFYKHNSLLLKKVGSIVKAGEAVAIIGNTGTLSSGPHLHFELWQNGKPVDPTEFISF